MWTTEVSAVSSAPLEAVFALLSDMTTWPERGFENSTPVPGTGVTVRVAHLLEREGAGTRISYSATAHGPEGAAAEVGAEASADFADVIAALTARAESTAAARGAWA